MVQLFSNILSHVDLGTIAPNKQHNLGTTIGRPQVQPRPLTTATTMQTAVAALQWLSPRSLRSATRQTTWYENILLVLTDRPIDPISMDEEIVLSSRF